MSVCNMDEGGKSISNQQRANIRVPIAGAHIRIHALSLICNLVLLLDGQDAGLRRGQEVVQVRQLERSRERHRIEMTAGLRIDAMPFKPSRSQAQEYQRELLEYLRFRMRRGVEPWYKTRRLSPFRLTKRNARLWICQPRDRSLPPDVLHPIMT
jgi:hypothetical protein